ncbi:MAG: 4-hydroxy-tetrahydrodipicolinate synthase [Candidatus Eisenbacteria bacterium]|nr:4-hydroxy-tetrahydrodipicolinate synthase [Candidatus Eisenbacteria bacterium]
MISGAAVALVTPFRDGKVDFDGVDRLVDHVLEGGVDALVPAGCTGEAAALDTGERRELIRRVQKRAAGRAAVIPGTGTNVTATSIRLTLAAQELGVDGAMLITPYYNKPTQAGLAAHYRAVADATELPLMLYNVPGRTGVALAVPTILNLAAHPRIQAVKEASGSVDAVSKLCRAGALEVLSGDDSLTLPMMAVGAAGVVSVAANIYPRAVVEMVRAARAGDFERARRWHQALLPLFEILFVESNPGPAKHALARLELIREEFRLPLVPVTEASARSVDEVLAAVGRELHELGGMVA